MGADDKSIVVYLLVIERVVIEVHMDNGGDKGTGSWEEGASIHTGFLNYRIYRIGY
jgi:6-phosphogluconate dehydrogenase